MNLVGAIGIAGMGSPRHQSGGSDVGSERRHPAVDCQRKQMVLDTVGATVKTQCHNCREAYLTAGYVEGAAPR
jgi:hypothetical protein